MKPSTVKTISVILAVVMVGSLLYSLTASFF